MEQQRTNKKFQYNPIEPGNEEFQSSSQTLMSSLGGTNTYVRPPNPSVSEVKPGLNFSIQTGEEFSLEFMRDRVNQWKPLLPNTVGDPSYAPGYMELKGILGISHTGSESGSDISMVNMAERGTSQFERANSSRGDRSVYTSAQSIPRMSSGYESNRGVNVGYTSSGTSDSSSAKIKVLCSYGGNIIPRPSDSKLRYVGGETHIVRIRKDISWQELTQKVHSIYNQTHVIKYQLPGEDLDALVSVSSDEDLQNMMEECSESENSSQKLRMFLFSKSDLEDAQFGLNSMDGDSEVHYMVAVNGMDLGSRKISNANLAGSSANNLDFLDREGIQKEKSLAATGVGSADLTGGVVSSAASQFPEPVVPSSSNLYENDHHFYHGQLMHHGEDAQYKLHSSHVPSSSPFVDDSSSVPLNEFMDQQMRMTQERSFSGTGVETLEMPVRRELKPKHDALVQQASNQEKASLLGIEYVVPSQPYDNMPTNYFPVEEASIPVTTPEGGIRSLSKKEAGGQEPSKIASSINSSTPPQIPKVSEDDHIPVSGTSFAPPGYVRSDSSVSDQSYPEPPVIPQRIYYSERLPREPAEFLNRSSKSDDSYGSPFLIHPHTNITRPDPVKDGFDKLHNDGNPASQIEQSTSAANTNDGVAKLQKPKEFVDSVYQMDPMLLQNVDGELKQGLPNPVDGKNVAKEDNALKADTSAISLKKGHKDMGDKMPTAVSEVPAETQISSIEQQVDAASNHPEHDFDAATGDDTISTSSAFPPQSFPWTESESQHFSQQEPSTSFSTSKQENIVIDIGDRFPRDFLSDIFSKAILCKDSSEFGLMNKDGPGVSLNMENHDRKSWSYFKNLAEDGINRNDVSLIDQDLGFSSELGRDGDDRSYPQMGLPSEVMSQDHVDPQLKFGEKKHNELPGPTAVDSLHSNYDHSLAKDTESMQFGAIMENLRVPDSEYEDGHFESRDVGLPPLDPSLGDKSKWQLQVIKNEDLEELKELGSGTFGTVYHGKWRGTDVAIKRIKKSCFTGRSSEQERLTVEFWREAKILSELHHPNVVAFYGVVEDGPGGTLATVAEYMVDGSLRHVLLRKDRYLDLRKRIIIAMDAAFGMEYLHAKKIVHFDLKCDNLLVNLKDPLRPICKVGDFGLSKIRKNTLISGGVRGTLPWMAPELLNGSSNKVSEKVDVFSFGIVLWEILTGEEPYANMHYGAIIGGIVNNTLRPKIPSNCDPDWRMLMEQCWAPNPFVRPSFTEIASRLRTMSAAAATQAKAQGHKASK